MASNYVHLYVISGLLKKKVLKTKQSDNHTTGSQFAKICFTILIFELVRLTWFYIILDTYSNKVPQSSFYISCLYICFNASLKKNSLESDSLLNISARRPVSVMSHGALCENECLNISLCGIFLQLATQVYCCQGPGM